MLRVLYANKHVLNFQMRKRLCEAYIMSMISYCMILYYPCLTREDKQRLQRMQNNCCRFIFGLKKYDHISQRICELNWLNMEQLFQYLLLTFIYKLLNSSTPMYLRSALVFRSDIHQILIRSDTLTMPQHRKAVFQRGFTYNAVKLFNNYNSYFTSSSLVVFRRRVRIALLQKQRNPNAED